MDIQAGFFYAFSVVLLFAAFRVVTARNPVHAVLYLVLTFFQAAMIWMLLKAEFLSITLVLVYVGAVMVLFLFVVMMLDINVDSLRRGFWRHFPLVGTIGALVAVEMIAVLMMGFRATEPKPAAVAAAAAVPNTQALGQLLYSEYVMPVQVAAVILLVAIIAAIALTLRGRKDTKHTDASVQVRVRAADRLRMVKLAPTPPAPPPAAPGAGEKQA